MIRIGLMGCGTVADYGHLPAICGTEGLALAALFDPDRRRLDLAGEKFGVPSARRFIDADAFFAEKLDAVSVTSPAPCHVENVLAAASHSVHVLCEKPLAETEADGWKMVHAMRQAKRNLFVGFIYRFSEMTRNIRDAIRDGAIGELRSIRLVNIWDCHGKYIRDASLSVVQADATADEQGRVRNLRRDRFMREGGPMIDCGVHQIDLARWWAGSEITRFASHGTRIDDEYACPDHVYIHATHENGVHSMIESSFSYGHSAKEPQVHYRFDAIGTGGVMRFDHGRNSLELVQPSGTTHFPYRQGKGFAAMYEQLREAIRSGVVGAFASGEDGIIATRIARQAVTRP